MDYRNKDEKKTHKAELWFQRDIFKNLIDEKDEDADLDKMVEEYKKKGAKVIGKEEQLMFLNQKCYIFMFLGESDNAKNKKESKKEQKKSKSKVAQKETTSDYSSDGNDDSDDDSTDSDSDYDVEKEMHVSINNSKKDGFEVVKKTTGII